MSSCSQFPVESCDPWRLATISPWKGLAAAVQDGHGQVEYLKWVCTFVHVVAFVSLDMFCPSCKNARAIGLHVRLWPSAAVYLHCKKQNSSALFITLSCTILSSIILPPISVSLCLFVSSRLESSSASSPSTVPTPSCSLKAPISSKMGASGIHRQQQAIFHQHVMDPSIGQSRQEPPSSR